MHIEPETVNGAKMVLSYGTGALGAGLIARMAVETARTSGVAALAGRAMLATVAVLCFFEVLPHHPVGVSEVHLILGSTLYLLLGAGPAAIGLALGLLIQGLLFAPFDLPQYGMNLTTLIVPLFTMGLLARRIVPEGTRYANLGYGQVLALSATYQGGIVGWVAFWALYGQGVGAETLSAVGAFGAAYMTVLVAEPLIDLAVLALAKMRGGTPHPLLNARLYSPA